MEVDPLPDHHILSGDIFGLPVWNFAIDICGIEWSGYTNNHVGRRQLIVEIGLDRYIIGNLRRADFVDGWNNPEGKLDIGSGTITGTWGQQTIR